MTPGSGPLMRADHSLRQRLRDRPLVALGLAALAALAIVMLARTAPLAADAAPGRAAAAPARDGRTASPAPRAVAQYTIEEFLATTNLQGASFSPDHDKILLSSDQTGVFNAFAVPLAGGEPVQLTNSTTNSIFAESYFPHDERLLYSSDQGGNELDHLYVRELDSSVKDLTPGEKLKAEFVGWAHDDSSFFIRTNERDARYFDLYEIAVNGYARTLVYQDDTGYEQATVSPDKHWIAFQKVSTTTDSDIHLYDRQSKQLRPLTPHQGDVVNQPVGFSSDGKSLYLITDAGSEFSYLAKMDLASANSEVVEKPDWDVPFVEFSKGGRYCAVGINSDAKTQIRLYAVDGWKPVTLPQLPDAEISAVSISGDESTFAFYASASRLPRDLFACAIGGQSARQLTHSLTHKIDPQDLAEPKVVRFSSYDGVEVPGILYKPYGASPQSKVPALVWVHGGPGGQARVGYLALIQYLVNHGYVVYSINNRGSSGYGKTFFKMDDRKHGEADLGDCIASKTMLIDTGYVDPARIGILGGSYGGFMTLAALAFHPDEFAAGVDLFGVANWVRTLQSMPAWWESIRKALYVELGDPVTDGERLHRISPLFSAGNIKKPLLVLQGKNDPRVLKQESDDMVAAARGNGATVEYLVFDDEGHGFVKKENQVRGYKAVLDFLDKYLKGSAM
jgi:dipeptidyl aminopeptidase/acylaminoacyl peptidase